MICDLEKFVATRFTATCFFMAIVLSPVFAAVPAVSSLTPSSGIAIPDTNKSFTAIFTDASGYAHIKECYLLFGASSDDHSNAVYLYYDQSANLLYLRNDDNSAWLGGYAPGSSNNIENSYCRVACSNISVSSTGDTLTVGWSVVFKNTFVGPKNSYLRVNDVDGAISQWVGFGSWYIGNDIVAPAGSVSINNGDLLTNSRDVILTLSAQDNTGGSGIDMMRFSNDNQIWSAAEAFAATKNWELLTSDGSKTVYAQFNDKAGNWSSVSSAGITLDTVQPVVTISSPLDNEEYGL